MNRRYVPILIVSLLLALPALPGAQSDKAAMSASVVKQPLVRKSAEAITAAELKDYLSFIASDLMEGRATPSRGLDTTAQFLATTLARMGAKPGGDDGTYMQKIALKKERLVAEGTELQVGTQKFTYGKDFLATGTAGTVTGPMVYVGDGWYVKSKNIDAYQGLDVKGKVVIVNQVSGLPAGVTMADLMNGKRGEDWIDPMSYAQKKGALGAIALMSLMNQANPDNLEAMRKQVETGTYAVEKLPRSASQLPSVIVNVKVAQAIFAKEVTGANAILATFATGTPTGTPIKPFELSSDKKITFTVKTTIEKTATQNVVAIVEGSDPALKAEYVALGAHYDHVGTGNPINGDSIRNGADDDGTGTIGLLAIADALMKAPRHPKRSTLFVWHMGEEMGLWGSQYFTTFPTVPLDKIVAQLNIDMIGRTKPAGDTDPRDKDLSGPNEVYVIGSKMMSTELGQLSEAVNKEYLKLSFNYKYDDPKDPEKFFYRSDHVHYATKGIPIIFYFTGVHADYHQPSDEVSKIDFGKYEKVTRTIYAMVWEVGELKARPKVDKPLKDVTMPF
ncbi:MAG: M28 family peptidase [Bacteroidales bacterium]